MSGTDLDARRSEMGRWLAHADDDVRAVVACLSISPPALPAAAYHCQQAAEKVLKGLLILAAVPFRRTHDLKELRNLVAPVFPDIEPLVTPLLPITVWGFAYRYPFEEEPQDPLDEDGIRVALAQIQALASAVTAASPPNPS